MLFSQAQNALNNCVLGNTTILAETTGEHEIGLIMQTISSGGQSQAAQQAAPPVTHRGSTPATPLGAGNGGAGGNNGAGNNDNDNRQIVSAARDKTIKLWNTLAQCKYTIQEDGHQDWVSCVRFSPNNQNPIIVSAGWDKYVKVWNLTNCKLKTNHIGHTGYLNTVTMSPDGSLCASGGKDAKAMLWDLNDGKHLYTLDHADTINALTFSPNRYILHHLSCGKAGKQGLWATY